MTLPILDLDYQQSAQNEQKYLFFPFLFYANFSNEKNNVIIPQFDDTYESFKM